MGNDQIEFLTPASNWKKRNGRERKVLFISNTSLPEKQLENHPPQVVYVDGVGNVFSMGVEEFLGYHTFYNVDPVVEERLNNLLLPEEDAEEHGPESELSSGNGGLEPLTLEPPVGPTLAQLLTATASESVLKQDILFIMSHGNEPAISEDGLRQNFVSYSQGPNKSYSVMEHRLVFWLDHQVTISSLKAAFIPDDERSTVDAFSVSGIHHNEIVAWDTYIGVYPELHADGSAFGVVLIATTEEPLESQSSIEQDHMHISVDQEIASIEQSLMDLYPANTTDVVNVQAQEVIHAEPLQVLNLGNPSVLSVTNVS